MQPVSSTAIQDITVTCGLLAVQQQGKGSNFILHAISRLFGSTASQELTSCIQTKGYKRLLSKNFHLLSEQKQGGSKSTSPADSCLTTERTLWPTGCRGFVPARPGSSSGIGRWGSVVPVRSTGSPGTAGDANRLVQFSS